MRTPIALAFLLLLPSVSVAQNKEIQDAIDQKLAAIRYVRGLQDAETGAFRASADAKGPGLRATSAAVRSLKYLTGKPTREAVPNADKAAAFVLACFDPKTGGFADAPGGKPDVTLTSVGVMAAVELEVPKEKFARAMDYLKANAATFEDVRIGAAAVEAWGVNVCPFDLKEWRQIAQSQVKRAADDKTDGKARELASVEAMFARLGWGTTPAVGGMLADGQRPDGGWGKGGEKGSDLETTYRVMRAFYLLKAHPKGAAKLREFIAGCHNADGGYGVKPGEPSNVGAVYYATIITKWLHELEQK
jgi:hypothetical protein